jgi:hypothetical protein
MATETNVASLGVDIDPATVRDVRTGNRLTPGLAAFTGVSFLVYLAVKVASGTLPLDAGGWTQIGVSAALGGYGFGLLVRARYFYVDVVTDAGTRRFAGLSKAEQQALAARLRAA